jgi:hypothetical protein
MKRVILPLVAAALLSILPASAAVIFSEDFSGDSSGLTKTTLVNWNVLNGTNVDIGEFGALCSPGPQQCVDMQGSGGNSSGDIETKSAFALGPGFNYTFAYTADNAGNSTVRLRIGTAVDQIIATGNGSFTINFTAEAQNATIRLTDTSSPDNVGTYLGNIVLSSDVATSAIPEPSTFILLGAGITGFVAVRRRLS